MTTHSSPQHLTIQSTAGIVSLISIFCCVTSVFAQSPTPIPADLNHDGIVDQKDLLILANEWHKGQVLSPTITPTPTARGYDMVDYCPLKRGNVWTYRQGVGTFDFEVVDTRNVHGVEYWGLKTGGPCGADEVGYFTAVNGLQVGAIPDGEGGIIDLDSPIRFTNPTAHVGDVVNDVLDLGSDCPLNFKTRFVGLETIEVPAGIFENCIKLVKYHGNTECPDPGSNGGIEETCWFAHSVGLVKVTVSDVTPESYDGCLFLDRGTMELQSAIIGGEKY